MFTTDPGKEFYDRNRAYYDRNAIRYEASSWYLFNKYKRNSVLRELKICLQLIETKTDIRILEIGAGTGYLLGNILSLPRIVVNYTGIEHSREMARIISERYSSSCRSFSIINESITTDNLQSMFQGEIYDLIIGSSILHHLIDYDEIIEVLSKLLKPEGVMYFVREPIHKDECQPGNLLMNVLEKGYSLVNNLLMTPPLRKYLWPNKVKAEDASNIAYHMYKSGVSTRVFRKLEENNFSIVFTRRYNRRVSSLFSYIENQWLAHLRKDLFGNTLFSICLRKCK